MKKESILQILFLGICCFLFNSINYRLVDNYKGISNLTQRVLKRNDSITFKGYVLKIETYYLHDSVTVTSRRIFNPIVIKQKLIFIKAGKILNQILNDNNKIYQQTKSGEKILMLSEVYYHAYVVQGRYKSVFVVAGTGGCNSCPETLDFYSLNGTSAFKTNSTKDFNSFLKEYGISNYSTSDREILFYPF